MLISTIFRLAFALLLYASATIASAALPYVVLVQVRLSEQSVEKVESGVTSPIQGPVKKIAGVKGLSSATTHGLSTTEVEFEQEATEPELALVRETIQAISFDKALGVQSISFVLAKKSAVH